MSEVSGIIETEEDVGKPSLVGRVPDKLKGKEMLRLCSQLNLADNPVHPSRMM